MDLSMGTREAAWAALEAEPHDLVVVGGGITGAGVAWDAAARGLKVLLVERGDFGSGTSSKSSKLLHGGVRYLEQFEFGLVFSSIAQRNSLFGDAPHLARELPFLFPVRRGKGPPAWYVGIGLGIYDAMSFVSDRTRRYRHRWLPRTRVKELEPALGGSDLKGAHRYVDGVTNDARLTLAAIRSAAEAGARVLNHVELVGFRKDAQGKITGVRLRDRLTGREREGSCTRVVNATGPWCDALLRLDDPKARHRLRPTKGVHLLVRGLVHDHAVLLNTVEAPGVKPRVMFVIPWEGRTLVGTTDTAHHGDPEDLRYLDEDLDARPDEVAYLLRSVNAAFPKAALKPADVLSSFAGWRPLLAPHQDDRRESEISREHLIWTAPSGLISIAGGKLTAFRTMAREVVDHAVSRWPGASPAVHPSAIEHAPLFGAERGFDATRHADELARKHPKVAPEILAHLVVSYAAEAGALLARAAREPDRRLLAWLDGLDPEARRLRIEVVHAAEAELAVKLEDFLARRTRISLLDGRQGLAAAREVALLMAPLVAPGLGLELGAWARNEENAYRAELDRQRTRRENP